MHTATENPAILDPPPGSLRNRDNRFYELLAGGARTRVLEGFLDLKIPELLGAEGPLTAVEICRRLNLDPHRGWKFLHLLALTGLLDEQGAEHGDDLAIFGLSAEAKEFFGDDGRGGYFFRDLVNYWRNVAILPLADVLAGMPLPNAVRWPPPGEEAAVHLETWMRVTAGGAIKTLLHSGAMSGAQRLLDVGGGDGTIGCALAHQDPQLRVTVFNLPASAALARQTVAVRRFAERVSVHEGNFLEDELPSGFDRVLFSRVLTDWEPDVCRMLFEKARRALVPEGRLLINEALVDGNLDYTVAWEFRYLFYDTFGRAMFKPLAVYRQLLADAGFQIARVSPMLDDAFYSVIEATAV
ncbi:MAG TPA: methyltransferase [Pirellulales bacterium]|jgi:precorrin-6B methylase 2|nr:methyltransferase [Pirellulales bacterium]